MLAKYGVLENDTHRTAPGVTKGVSSRIRREKNLGGRPHCDVKANVGARRTAVSRVVQSSVNKKREEGNHSHYTLSVRV